MTELNETNLPKSGRVNEVCKEWLVREDNALAYRLQSQEINEHYKGNRFRNQVVRQDFPTALNEQIKEKENAERQAAIYHQMINELEEADEKVARDLDERLRRDIELEHRKNAEKSEQLARHMQQNLVLQSKIPLPPPEPAVNELPIPPKKLGTRFTGRNVSMPSTSASAYPPKPTVLDSPPQLNYVSLELNTPRNGPSRIINHSATQYTQVIAQNQNYSPTSTLSSPSDSHYEHINLHSHTPEKKQPQTVVPERNANLASVNSVALPPKPVKQLPMSKPSGSQYELPALPPKHPILKQNTVQMLSTETFDILMGNKQSPEPDELDSTIEGAVALKSSDMNHNLPSNSNRLDQMNDIRPYRDDDQQASGSSNVERIRTLQEFGVPVDEILEIDRRLTQQEKDEELARILQAEEGKTLTQEEKDHLLAIEAQDKELARMLQERERAKAKRAKEKARLRKQQLQEQRIQQENAESHAEYTSSNHSRTQSDPCEMDGDSYSDPVDMIQPQAGNHKPPYQNLPSYRAGEYHHSKQSSGTSRDSQTYTDENYSNPIDLIQDPVSASPNRSGSSDHSRRRDEMYVTPIDGAFESPPRPNKLEVRGQYNRQQSSPKSHGSDGVENIAAVIDPTYPNVAAAPSVSTSSVTGVLPKHLDYKTTDHNSNPVPPYMPIQGTRRNNAVSQSDKKKKTKDKCTHQ